MRRLLFKTLIFGFLCLFFLPVFLSAQSPPSTPNQGYTPLAPIAGFVENQSYDLASYLNQMFRFGIYLATGLAVIMIIVGGVEYVSSDTITNKSEGKEKITSALWGLGLALGSYMLLNTINPALLKTNISFTGQNTTAADPLQVAGLTQPGLGDKTIDHQETQPNGTFYDFSDNTHAWKSLDGTVNCYDSNWSWQSYGPCL